MINTVWLFLIITGILVAAANGRIDAVTQAAISSAENAVNLSFGLIGVMVLWMGIMKIAEKAGLVNLLTKVFQPFARFLFPSIPKGHPAMGAVLLNISANVLGLGNAATPLGLKAMQELQKLNHHHDTATDAMCTLLVINTAGFTLVPVGIIALRSAAGSANPTEIVGATLFATTCATITAIIIDCLLRRFFRITPRRR